MSNDQHPSGGSGDASQQSQEQEVKVVMSAEDYAKHTAALAEENRRLREKSVERGQKLKELEEKLAQEQKAKLEEQGKWKEIAELERQKREEAEKKHDTLMHSYAFKTVTSQVAEEALKMGCVDVNDLLKLVPLQELDYEDQDNYVVKKDSLKNLMETQLKKRPYLFSKAAPKVADGTPKSNGVEPKSFSKMSEQEKVMLLKQALSKQLT